MKTNSGGGPSLHVMVISWPGQHENAARIANELAGCAEHVSIVYSDPDSQLEPRAACELIRRPNHLFFGDKFKACVDFCRGDLMLLIHADCTCDDWQGLLGKCRHAYSLDLNVGIWSPLVNYTAFDLALTEVVAIGNSSLSTVVFVDAIVWCISAPIIGRMRQLRFDDNIYGWGVSPLGCAYALSHNMTIVVDKSVPVSHPRESGYSVAEAKMQSKKFRDQFSLMELIQARQRASHMTLRAQALNKLRAGNRQAAGKADSV